VRDGSRPSLTFLVPRNNRIRPLQSFNQALLTTERSPATGRIDFSMLMRLARALIPTPFSGSTGKGTYSRLRR
jgi:hypothetical protein